MSRRLKFVLWIYLAGAFVSELMLMWGAYQVGVFQRAHTLGEVVTTGLFHFAFALLWPILVIIAVLQYFGVLPHPIAL